jgi:Na+/H+ antiporter NhaD/arsenite permease-like protein
MAIPFALSGGAVTGTAVALGRIGPRDVGRAIPYLALALIVAAAVAAGPISTETHLVPQPSVDLSGLVLAVIVGGLLASAVNNLPAAAFGALWLSHAPVAVIVAYLIGTNVASVATPHGSAATMLVRSGGAHRGASLPATAHLRTAWLYAVVGSAAALGFLVATTR